MTDEKPEGSAKPKGISPALIIIIMVAALFAGVLFAKVQAKPQTASVSASGTAAIGDASQAAATITSTHNDAVADYEAALKTGKPIYVLFHSLTCDPCVEISAVVDKVMPGYDGKVVFVNAISDDPSAQQLASKFQFQYIPTSFFLSPDGKITDSFTGAMNDVDMKARLDKLIAQ